MNLAIDIGNTNSKYGFFEGEALKESGVLEGLEALGRFLAARSQDFDQAIVCSVNYSWEELKAYSPPGCPVTYLDLNTPVPLKLSYDTPETLGMDRLAAAIGAHFEFLGQAVMVIDIGTCITYDFVNEQGVFEGGVISPGMELRYKAMHNYTARLPLLSDTTADRLIGKSTREAMRSGVINGIAGEIDYMISQFMLKSPDLKVIITGGGAKAFESKIKADIFVALKIVLVGLNRVLEKNA